LSFLFFTLGSFAQVPLTNYQAVSGSATGYGVVTYVGTFTETANSTDTVCLALNVSSPPTTSFEPQIAIYAPNGNRLTAANFDDTGAHFCFQYWPYTGTYSVGVYNIEDTTVEGSFYLQFIRPGDPYNPSSLGGGQLYPGASGTGSLPLWYFQLWTIPVNAGDNVTVAASKITGEIPDYLYLQFQLYGPNGVEQESSYNDPAGLSFTPTLTGNYTILAYQRAGSTTVANPMTYDITVTGSTAIPLQFVPVTPCRIADTRNVAGPFGGPELSAGATRTFAIPQSACNIPSTAVAYSLNVTAVPDAALGYLSIWPSGQSQPVVSTLNSDGRVKANAAIVPAGTDGGVNVYVTDASHVILDIDGYFAPKGTASALAFYPITPCRVADTRNAAGPLGGPTIGGGTSRSFPVQTSNCNLPASALAYSLNVTSIPHEPLHYLTMWPSGQAQPLVSTLNAYKGTVTANAAIVPAGTSGAVSVYVSDTSDVVLDVNGYFAAPEDGSLALYTAPPCRLLDTRSTSGAFSGALIVPVEVSACGTMPAAKAYIMNATVVPPSPLNYLTLWPHGENQPLVSTLNAADGSVTSNMAIVPTDDGEIEAYSTSSTQLLLDLSAYFAP
jgi:hypothetical protein